MFKFTRQIFCCLLIGLCWLVGAVETEARVYTDEELSRINQGLLPDGSTYQPAKKITKTFLSVKATKKSYTVGQTPSAKITLNNFFAGRVTGKLVYGYSGVLPQPFLTTKTIDLAVGEELSYDLSASMIQVENSTGRLNFFADFTPDDNSASLKITYSAQALVTIDSSQVTLKVSGLDQPTMNKALTIKTSVGDAKNLTYTTVVTDTSGKKTTVKSNAAKYTPKKPGVYTVEVTATNAKTGQAKTYSKKIYVPDPKAKVNGAKIAADAGLYRTPDKKIFWVSGGQKTYIATVADLAKYAGWPLIEVGESFLAGYENAN